MFYTSGLNSYPGDTSLRSDGGCSSSYKAGNVDSSQYDLQPHMSILNLTSNQTTYRFTNLPYGNYYFRWQRIGDVALSGTTVSFGSTTNVRTTYSTIGGPYKLFTIRYPDAPYSLMDSWNITIPVPGYIGYYENINEISFQIDRSNSFDNSVDVIITQTGAPGAGYVYVWGWIQRLPYIFEWIPGSGSIFDSMSTAIGMQEAGT